MTWDAFQREMLGALGHTLLVPAAAHEREATRAVDAPEPVAGGHPPPVLLRALMRAAGRAAADVADLPPLEQLRTPAAKRALWPRLRALRRKARG